MTRSSHKLTPTSPEATPPPAGAASNDGVSDDGAQGEAASSAGLSRRGLLGLAGTGLAVLGLGGGFAAGHASARVGAPSGARSAASPGSANRTHAFTGARQAGIVTAAQDRLHFATFDLTTTSRADVIALLRRWTFAADRMTRGLPAGTYGPASGPYDAPPDDTGEADELGASGLTITFGFGPSMFEDVDGKDRFGLAGRRPELLKDFPHFPGDTLQPGRCGGDIAIQACADDPQVAVHAIRNLARLAFGTAALRWSQLGYGRTSTTSVSQSTPRNLFGFKDGTSNIMAEHTDALDEHVWVAPGDDAKADWLAGGSYLVARRIAMTIETWDRTSLREQETLIGRAKGSGSPLSGGDEHTEVDFKATGRGGATLIDPGSHIALAHPSANGGARMLRRGYNYTDGSDGLGRLDAGLFFIAFVRNPATQYIPMQTAMGRHDLLVEYLRHTGSGLWAVPPGLAKGTRLDPVDGAFVGQDLFA